MAEPFLGEIKLFAFSYAPRGWAFCSGQLLPINQNQALFALLGTMYGGNGQTTFALPNIQDRVLIGFNNTWPQGAVGGQAVHTLTTSEIPPHSHVMFCTKETSTVNAPGAGLAYGTGDGTERNEKLFADSGADSSNMVLAPVGGSQPHENHQPSLVMNYCIAMQGIFPSRN